MNNRTMATVYVDRDSISLKTRSRSGCSPQHVIILKKELQRLEEKKYLITKDIHSYVAVSYTHLSIRKKNWLCPSGYLKRRQHNGTEYF